jgi:hypothetical protein
MIISRDHVIRRQCGRGARFSRMKLARPIRELAAMA